MDQLDTAPAPISASKAVAIRFAQEIEYGCVAHDLDPHGFSVIVAQVNGVHVRVKWWRDKTIDRIVIDDQAFIGSAEEAGILLQAALKRSKSLLAEKLADLSKKVLVTEEA